MEDHGTDRDLTTTTASTALPHADAQAAPPVTVMRVAKLRTREREELCLVRNISERGLLAHVYSDLKVGDSVTAEFKSGHAVSGHVLWRGEGQARIGFDEPANFARVLSDKYDDSESCFHARAPRIDIAVRARLRIGARYCTVTLCNISQSGARVRPGDALEPAQRAVLSVSGLAPIACTVRWCDADHAGLAFDIPIAFEVLARWVSTVPIQPPSGKA